MIECCYDASTWCFPPDAAVDVQGRGSTAMKDLRVGDNVEVSSDGVFEPIYGIPHESHDPANFLKIQTKNGALEISENHMLFVGSSQTCCGERRQRRRFFDQRRFPAKHKHPIDNRKSVLYYAPWPCSIEKELVRMDL